MHVFSNPFQPDDIEKLCRVAQRGTKTRSSNCSLWMDCKTNWKPDQTAITRLAIKQEYQIIQRVHAITCDEKRSNPVSRQPLTNPVAFRLHTILPWYTLCIIFHLYVFFKWRTTDERIQDAMSNNCRFKRVLGFDTWDLTEIFFILWCISLIQLYTFYCNPFLLSCYLVVYFNGGHFLL